ncbi:MAG: aminopeptidase P family protein [Chlamydiae bacterium]|nr:aminopeptidase P family protein [Chlamydiota bacterium]MBI3278060.1 aminopeptidase P family protein [Chlamydiota bacterium]
MTSASLIVADSEKDSNLYYATGFLAPDPFIYIALNGKKILIMGDLELDRAKLQAEVDEVISSTEILMRLRLKRIAQPKSVDMIEFVLKELDVKGILVPGNFPIEYADPLREKGFSISFKREPFFEERLIKRPKEIEAICQTQRATEEAVEEAVEVISSSKIRGEFLYHHGEILTSRKIKEILHLSLMRQNCIGQYTIVACGTDGVDPHNEGSGPLKAHQSIILDVFPRSMTTRYFADMTRTVVRGKASPKLKKMYQAVLEGQEIGFKQVREGADGRSIHQMILDRFKSLGFETGKIDGRFQGFFHGTGHGVGLDIHELPRIGSLSNILQAGQVVTIEPGLYYLDAGGVRLEDMVLVTKEGCENLTRFPKELEVE